VVGARAPPSSNIKGLPAQHPLRPSRKGICPPYKHGPPYSDLRDTEIAHRLRAIFEPARLFLLPMAPPPRAIDRMLRSRAAGFVLIGHSKEKIRRGRDFPRWAGHEDAPQHNPCLKLVVLEQDRDAVMVARAVPAAIAL
jgi:hypothetical protein